MKLSAIGPFTATPAAEVDRSLEAQEVTKKGQKPRPVSEDSPSPQPRDTTDEEARKGFVRLADFLSQQKKDKKSAKKSLQQRAAKAYKYIDTWEQEQKSRAKHLDDVV